MKFTEIDNPEPITLNGVEVIPDKSYDVDVDEGGPFITPESDSGTSIIGGDTGIDADYCAPSITIIESEAEWAELQLQS